MGRTIGPRPRRMMALILPAALVAGALPAGPAAAGPHRARDTARTAAAQPAARICRSSAHPHIAAKLARDIQAAIDVRRSYAAVGVYDRGKRLTCLWRQRRHFDSASIVKVTILAALLRKAHGRLTTTERSLAWRMITRSDNDAASSLWRRAGRGALAGFLHAAKMTHTTLGPDGYWGLTQVTAADELALLRLLTRDNDVITAKSRRYVLYLMNHVIASQRWGTPAGAPDGVTVHVKNGWLPRSTHGWRIHSLGAFTGHGHDYMIVVLSHDNPSMSYGVTTVERVARAVHRDLNPGERLTVDTTPAPAWGRSDGSAPYRAAGR